MKHLKTLALFAAACGLMAAGVLFAEDQTLGLAVNVEHFTIHCQTADEREQIELRSRISKLILQTFVDDMHGVHDVRKMREIKKLAEKIED